MKGAIDRLAGMPAAVKLGLALLVLAVLVVAAVLLLGLGPLATAVLVVGLLLVAGLLLGFLAVLAAIRRRRTAPFEAELAANSGAVPDGISEAAARARLDDLRRRFEEGVDTFKRHGKDLYGLPWYVIVGEPGSGKTEVLRHSNIGFPPGLQDELQGSGGTINMDWWFANQAVILDTAGRLMFEDAAARSNSEWAEFLKLLARHRPNCPINGLMLVIPADSLIRDTADEIDDKARRIARQLDLIQRTLDVRFPVFILVTKSDLINGFREFFDGLDDPQLAHQMLGWSNPAPLDEPFDPAQVQEHLLDIEDRLIRRRFGLMVDPVARAGAQARRLDEVDAMYALPEAMVGVAPRLRRYLEHVFPAGEWTAKPLFLRGIYFVSSMREGSALDAELAEALGVPVEQLPEEGRAWERDRSYFIKDLFLEKMFRERGLVTRASNTRELRRKRRIALFGATGLAAAVLLAVSVLQASALRRSVEQPRAFWSAVADVYGADTASDSFPAVVGGARRRAGDADLRYLGDQAVDPAGRLRRDGERLSIARAAEAVAAEVERPIRVPLIFRPAMLFAGGGTDLLGAGRREAGRAAVERSIIEPIVRRAAASLAAGEPAAGERDAAVAGWIALAELVQAANDDGRPVPSLDPLLRWTLRPSAVEGGDWTHYEAAATSVASLDRAVASLADGGGGRRWLRRALRTARPSLLADLSVAAGHLERVWLAEFEGTGDSDLAIARRIGRALEAFRAAETRLLDRYGPVGAPGAEDDLVPFDETMAELDAAATTLEETLPLLGGRRYADFAVQAASRGLESSVADVEAMLAVLPAADDAPLAGADAVVPGGDEAVAGVDGGDAEAATRAAEAAAADRADDVAALRVLRTRLESARDAIEARAATNEDEVSAFVALGGALEPTAGGEPEFAVRHEMYAAAAALRAEEPELERFAELPARLANLRERIDERRRTNDRLGQGAPADLVVRAAAASNHVLERSLVLRREALVGLAVDRPDAPRTADDVADLVAGLAAERGDGDALVDVPLAELPGRRGMFRREFDRRSGPAVARALLDAEATLRELPGGRSADAADTIREAVEDWVVEYAEYWGDMLTVPEHVRRFGSWGEVVDALQGLRVQDLNDELADLLELRRDAVERIPPAAEAGWSESVVEVVDDVAAQLAAMDEELGRGSTLPDDARTWARSWQELGRDPAEARRRLLGTSAFVFNNDFLHLVGRRKTERVDFYRLMTLIALERLRDDTVRVTADARRRLQTATWFPVRALPSAAEPADLQSTRDAATRQMTPREVAAAAEALALLRPGGAGSGADRGFPSGTVGAVENGRPFTTGFGDVDAALSDLRGEAPGRFDAELAALARVIEALPADPDRPLQCRMTLRGLAPTDSALPASDRFPELQVLLDGEPAGPFVDMRRPQVELGTVSYPGPGLAFALARVEDGAGRRVHRELVAGPWAPLALLHAFADSARTTDDGTTWEIEVAFTDSTSGEAGPLRFAFRLVLEFDRPLPPPAEWPR